MTVGLDIPGCGDPNRGELAGRVPPAPLPPAQALLLPGPPPGHRLAPPRHRARARAPRRGSPTDQVNTGANGQAAMWGYRVGLCVL